MFDGFTTELIDVGNGIRIKALIGGTGAPVLLLHGYPQTHVCWHIVAPLLAAQHRVVAADLRGYGGSSKPAGDASHAAYSKRAMAEDQVRLMRRLGLPRFHLVGHDRGGRVAHRLALDHGDAVVSLAVLDIAPTAAMYAATDMAFAAAYYHWFFLIQPFDLPERLISAEAAYYLDWTLASWSKTKGAITDAARAAYHAAWREPGAIHAACEDYRAAASIDLEHDRETAQADQRLDVPVLALAGGRGVVHRMFDIEAAWRSAAARPDLVTYRALDCGHFLPEERPLETADALLAHFRGAGGV